jgi:outer membrane protein, heavy metal efflux system
MSSRLHLPSIACRLTVAGLAASGCVSPETTRLLDRAYEAAAPRLEERRATSEVDPVAPVECDIVVAQAVARSPGLAVMAHRARALVHAGRAEGSLPPAELGFEAWNLPLARPYALGEADMYMLELRQRFPAADSLDARARAMAEEAQAMIAELSSEERLVAERAANVCADYEQAFEEKRLQERQLALLSRMGQAVRARYTTGGAGLSEAARIDVEVAKVQRALARVDGDIARSRATLNAVLRRPPSAALGEPRRVPAETVSLTVEELIARAETTRGTTLSAAARVRATEARRDAAEAEAHSPEFMVGLGYWQDPSMRPGMGVTASMSLPWLWGPKRDRASQAAEEAAAERAARDNVQLDTQSEVSEAHARVLALEAQLSVIRGQALPATTRSMEALTAAFSTGNASLLEWVDIARSLLELEMEMIVLHGDLRRGVASLERTVGTALPRTPLPRDTPR